MNLLIPSSLAGKGQVEVLVTGPRESRRIRSTSSFNEDAACIKDPDRRLTFALCGLASAAGIVIPVGALH